MPGLRTTSVGREITIFELADAAAFGFVATFIGVDVAVVVVGDALRLPLLVFGEEFVDVFAA